MQVQLKTSTEKTNKKLRYFLEMANYNYLEAADAREAHSLIVDKQPDLILLDWMLPGTSGVELARRLKREEATSEIPIIMLTARGEEQDRVRGLEGGADDYMPKPFSPAELLARMRAVLRRIRPALAEEALSYGQLHMDLAAHKVSRGGEPLHLGPREFAILCFLMEHPGRVFSREHLLDRIWGNDIYVEARTVDVHIGRLRKKH